jgi:nicotinamide N-methyltransferase
MDRTLASVEFSHPALRGASPVTVRQNLDAPSAEEEGTARWVWPGATATARWLCDRDRGRWLENKHVLELGSGTGLLGLVAARLGAASVTLTDLPSELDLLRANVALNSIGGFVADARRASGVGRRDWNAAAHRPSASSFRVRRRAVLRLGVPQRRRTPKGSGADDASRAGRRRVSGRGERDFGKERKKTESSRVAVVAYQFRENVLGDSPFFDEVDVLFADPRRHDTEDEDLWLFEYRPKTER